MHVVLVKLLMAFHISRLLLIFEEQKATKTKLLVSGPFLSIRGDIPRHTEEEIFRSQVKKAFKDQAKKM